MWQENGDKFYGPQENEDGYEFAYREFYYEVVYPKDEPIPISLHDVPSRLEELEQKLKQLEDLEKKREAHLTTQ